MTLTDFERLNQTERFEVTIDYAKFLYTHTILNKKYLLYALI